MGIARWSHPVHLMTAKNIEEKSSPTQKKDFPQNPLKLNSPMGSLTDEIRALIIHHSSSLDFCVLLH